MVLYVLPVSRPGPWVVSYGPPMGIRSAKPFSSVFQEPFYMLCPIGNRLFQPNIIFLKALDVLWVQIGVAVQQNQAHPKTAKAG